ncbi:MAG: AAA family ATPase [Tessaracoccus sp.]
MAVTQSSVEQQRLLQFWWMLELFSPQPVPTPRSSSSSEQQVVEWTPGNPLPWENLPLPKSRGKTPLVWQHTVYLGVYDLEAAYERLHQSFGDDKDAFDERPRGNSACAGVKIDHEGRLVRGSAVLASGLWAVARIENSGPRDPNWADGFPKARRAFADAVDGYVGFLRAAAGKMGGGAPVHDEASLLELLRIARETSGIARNTDLATDRVIIASVAVPASRPRDSVDIDYLNSIYLDDLAAIRRHMVLRGDISEALAAYLTKDDALDVMSRVDVVAAPQAVDDGTTIEHLPAGRWPSSPTQPLALSQQFAVNRALNHLSKVHSVMGITAPPGTGKTTVLRDILAGNVVERARRLAALSQPDDAFTDTTHRWSGHSGHQRSVRVLRPELTGFEMVVASSDDTAVGNIATDLSSHDAIDERWHDGADYLADIAAVTLATQTGGDSNTSDAAPAWGLLAAALDSRDNRAAFWRRFWHTDNDATASDTPRMLTRLTEWSNGGRAFTSWQEARNDFAAAESRVHGLIDERAQAQQRLRALPEAARHLEQLQEIAAQIGDSLQSAEQELGEHHKVLEHADVALTQAMAQHRSQLASKPGFLQVILTLGMATREWRASVDSLATELAEAENWHAAAADGDRHLQARVSQLRTDLAAVDANIAGAQSTLSELRTQCADDKTRYGRCYPDEQWSSNLRELHTPWLDEELDTARSELFLAALRLHESFIAHTSSDMIDGLRAAGDLVKGDHPANLEPEKLKAAWQLFFLVVPLVSTTFSSVGRLFGKVGPEAIGWLIVDEAGQAPPHHAVGAVWRARRVLALGDPLQLLPVPALPQRAQRDIAAAARVSPTWVPPQGSVQTLADRVTRYGTLLSQGEEPLWVSTPLRVHRRCDNPMFTLSNHIAYNRILINDVHRTIDDPDNPDAFDGPDGPLIEPSHWADEPAHTPGTNVQENQIARFERALASLREHGIAPSEVIALSPFREVADRLISLTFRYRGLQAGTIHTAPGRDAPVVFLVLGGDPGSPAAKSWAASSVNLLNVVASRATRRLYVIGDREAWAQYDYFHQLATALPPR